MSAVQTKPEAEVVLEAVVRYIGKYADSLSNLEAASAVKGLRKEIAQIRAQAAKGQWELIEKAWR